MAPQGCPMGSEVGGTQAGWTQGPCKGLQKAEVHTGTKEANGLARTAAVRWSKAAWPHTRPVSLAVRAANGLLPHTASSAITDTRLLHSKRLWGNGNCLHWELQTCLGTTLFLLAVFSLLVVDLGTVPSSMGCFLKALLASVKWRAYLPSRIV